MARYGMKVVIPGTIETVRPRVVDALKAQANLPLEAKKRLQAALVSLGS